MRSKALAFTAALASSAAFGSVPVSAADKTVTCTAVDSKAAVGHPGTIQVTYSTGNKICKFSVNGAAVDAAGTHADTLASNVSLMQQAREVAFSQAFDPALNPEHMEALVTVLTLPFLPVGQTDTVNALRDAIASEQDFLGRCLRDAVVPGTRPLDTTDRFVCGQLQLSPEPITLPVIEHISIEGSDLDDDTESPELHGTVVVIGARVNDDVFAAIIPQLALQPR